MGVAPACVPDPAPAPTRLDILTELTWCGGVIPPPGEPWCRTRATATDVQVFMKRDVVASGRSGDDGHLVVDVPAGGLVVRAADVPPYMQCDDAPVTAVAGATTPVTQSCTVYAP